MREIARLSADERVVRVLSSYSVSAEFSWIAARGLRCCVAGCFSEAEQASGRVEVGYVEGREAAGRASEFLAGARSVGELCGRMVALLVLARHAGEDAVAQSNRSFYSLSPAGGYGGGVPWGGDAASLLEAIAEERLPERLTARRREARAERWRSRSE